MPIPDFQTIMLPLLEHLQDRAEHDNSEILDALAGRLSLSQDEREELLPSGKSKVFTNRVAWAKVHLKAAALIESPRRTVYEITQRGMDVLSTQPERIDTQLLGEYPEYQNIRKPVRKPEIPPGPPGPPPDALTPEEHLDYGYGRMRHELGESLLETVKTSSPLFFERLVVELLVAMGYGGSRSDAGSTLGRAGDGGVDGVIKEDRLGLDVIYIQAKRWDATVGRPEIQKFAGALQGQRARKGVFITTSSFSQEAEDYAAQIESRIVLIDGTILTELMIDHGIGVTALTSYEVKRIDTDYFDEE